MKKNLVSSTLTRLAALLLATTVVHTTAMAATLTWDDGDTTNNWSVGANWTGTPDDTVPGSGDIAEFALSGSGSNQATLDSAQSVNGLSFNGGTGNFTISDSGTNTLTLGNGGITTDGDGNTYVVGATTLEHTTSITWTVAGADTLRISGQLTDNGGFDNLTKQGAGTVEFTGGVDITSHTVLSDGVTIANGGTFDNRGEVTIQNGAEFRVTGGAALKNNTADSFTAIIEDGGLVTLETSSGRVGSWTMKGGELNIQSGATFGDWGGANTTMMTYTAGPGEQAQITGDGSWDTGRLTRRIDVGDDAAVDVDMRIDVPLVNNDGRSGSFEKDGAGTLALHGDNTYNNPMNINAGTLLINGSPTGQGAYTVDSDATLGGTGTIGLAGGNSVTVNTGGTIAPGASVGTLNVDGDFAFGEDATYVWEFDDGTLDLVDITGDLALPANATVDVDVLNGSLSGNYTLFSAGSLSGERYESQVHCAKSFTSTRRRTQNGEIESYRNLPVRSRIRTEAVTRTRFG